MRQFLVTTLIGAMAGAMRCRGETVLVGTWSVPNPRYSEVRMDTRMDQPVRHNRAIKEIHRQGPGINSADPLKTAALLALAVVAGSAANSLHWIIHSVFDGEGGP